MIKRRVSHPKELDLSTFMSLMVVLIPVLLASAEFAKITIYDIEASKDGVRLDESNLNRPEVDERLKATLLVNDSAVTVSTSRGVLESLRFIAPAKDQSWETALLSDEQGKVVEGIFFEGTELMTDSLGNRIHSTKIGETYYLNGTLNSIVLNENTNVNKRNLLITDEVRVQLSLMQRNYGLFTDIKDMRIGASGTVKYDYLVQLMDASKKSGFENISFTKIRS